MGFRLQRSISLGKFVRLNISKSGLGLSAGVRGLRLSTGPRGTFINVDLPGTGLSYRKKLSSKSRGRKKQEAAPAQAAGEAPALDKPGFFAPGHEKALVKGLELYHEGQLTKALDQFMEAAPKEPGAAILAAAILAKQEPTAYQPVELLEAVVQSDEAFPTPLMEKYLAATEVDINITPHVTVTVPVDGLAATLLLVELYQAQRRVREAIVLLEEIDSLAQEPVLTLSLCELYASRELWTEIIDRAKQIESVDDVTLEIMIYYGAAMQALELHEGAITVLTKALRRKKDRSPELLHEARYRRALSYQAQGKDKRAHQELQKIYAENPDFRDVEERLIGPAPSQA